MKLQEFSEQQCWCRAEAGGTQHFQAVPQLNFRAKRKAKSHAFTRHRRSDPNSTCHFYTTSKSLKFTFN